MAEDKELAQARGHLQPGETLVEWSKGACTATMLGKPTLRHGVVLATDRRVFVFVKKMFSGFEIEEFPYNAMTSVDFGKGFTGHSLKLTVAGNVVAISYMRLGNPQALVDYVRSRVGAAKAPMVQPPALPPQSDDMLSKLERLANLHSAGMLTAEEFAQAKAKLLG